MASSPHVTPAQSRPSPPSPVHSLYSIDFNALSLDGGSDPTSPLPTRTAQHVRSEDIDGPSDFTENMQRWMRESTRSAPRIPRDSMFQSNLSQSVRDTTAARSDGLCANNVNLHQLQPTAQDFHTDMTPAKQTPSVSASESTVVPPPPSPRGDKSAHELTDQLRELRQRLQHAETSLAHQRLELDKAHAAQRAAREDSAKHKRDLDDMCESEDAEMHNLRCQLRDLRAHTERSAPPLGSPVSTDMDAGLKNKIEILERELGCLRFTNNKELETALATEKAERHRLEKELEMQRDLSRPADSDQVRDLRTALDKTGTDLAAKTSTIQGLTTRLQDSERARLDLHAKHDAAGQQLASTRAELQMLQDANSAFEARVSDAVTRREDYWRRREGEWTLERERVASNRAVMAKALLRQWGREECGIALEPWEKQQYAYISHKA